jgi:NarL family two-component system sensor histidine kinase LiaS
MNLFIRQMVVGILAAFLSSIPILALTFIAFPLERWSALWQVHLFDFPYLVVVVLVVIAVGTVCGFSYGVFWQAKLQKIDQQLDHLLKGQKVALDEVEPLKEIESIHDHINQLDAKLRKQTELSQRLATERAKEREKSLQEVVVQERNRLARELHDSVSQQLFAASMMMSAINESSPPKKQGTNKQLAMVEKMIHQSQLEMRALLLHLRPIALKGKTLQEGMEELLTELIQKVPLKIEWKIEAFDLDKGIEDHLFRILQESISNTLRHAKANHLHVMLIERDEYIIMRVTDDGVGFDVEEAKTSSYGLQNMQERALEVGGNFKVVSLENQGTRIEVKVPFIKKEVGSDD